MIRGDWNLFAANVFYLLRSKTQELQGNAETK